MEIELRLTPPPEGARIGTLPFHMAWKILFEDWTPEQVKEYLKSRDEG